MRDLLFLSVVVRMLTACAGSVALDPKRMDEATFERELTRHFYYEAPEPPAELDDDAAWRAADAAYFASFPRYDRSYAPEARREAPKQAHALTQTADALKATSSSC